MPSQGFDPADIRKFIEQAYPGISQNQLAVLLAGGNDPFDAWRRPEPQLLPVPATTRGFRIRLDLRHSKPPVWRRIDVPGDLTLARLHDVIQTVMGWTDSHLHRFRTGNDRSAAEFLTRFDLDEGDEGMLEDEVRLDQIVADAGDRLWYDYDFGDGWEHVLRVERVLETPPDAPVCVGGRLACPPEDCGGVWGYGELADWIRSGDDTLVPEVFTTPAEARAWLPPGWHPDVFDLDEANAALAVIAAEPIPVPEELESLLDWSANRGARGLRDALAHPALHGGAEVDADAAARMTEPFRVLIDAVGDGSMLTGAGYLKPDVVEQIATRAGVTDWWIGKANREDLTPPVAILRAATRALGLISVRKGRLALTQPAKRAGGSPEALLAHIRGRLPLGTTPADRHSGWMALIVVGSETPAEAWDQSISMLMRDLGWRAGGTRDGMPPADSPTLDVLRLLAGMTRSGRRLHGVDADVAAFARAALRVR